MRRLLPLALAVVLPALWGPSRAIAADPAVVAVKVAGEAKEAMTLEPSPASVKAGKVTFKVQNAAKTESHEMIVARVADPKAPLPYDEAKHRVIESKLQSLGEVSKIMPGQTKSLTLTLTPGKYVLVCNHTGHYKAGMVAALDVTK